MKTLKLFVVAAIAAAFAVVPATALASGDRDHDKLPDKWEKQFHLSTHKNSARGDRDRDHLSNRREFKFGMNPNKRDSDGDGVPDNQEQAGVVKSFDNGVLTIDLVSGDSLKGTVDARTEIECGDRNEVEKEDADNERRSHDDGSGDDDANEGPGNRGDDNEGPGDREDENENEMGNCSTADLVPGAKVHEAELTANSTGSHFTQIELIK